MGSVQKELLLWNTFALRLFQMYSKVDVCHLLISEIA